MYSSEDHERFYFQYQTEALPHGESLQSFCVKNKVPYNIFQKWYKDTRKKVVEVQVMVLLQLVMRKNPGLVINLNRYHQAEMITRFVFGLGFVSAMACICPKRI